MKGDSDMKNKPYEVAIVEFYYNGDGETFNRFLSSVVKDYVDADPSAPEETPEKSSENDEN